MALTGRAVYDRVRKRRSFQEALNGRFLIRDGDSQQDQFVGMVVCDLLYVRHSRRHPAHQLPQKFSRTHDCLFTEATWTAFPPVPAKVKSGARSSERSREPTPATGVPDAVAFSPCIVSGNFLPLRSTTRCSGTEAALLIDELSARAPIFAAAFPSIDWITSPS